MATPIVFAAKQSALTPATLLVALPIILLGGALAYRSWRMSGRIPVLALAGFLCALVLAVMLMVRLSENSASITIYADRIESGSERIPLNIVTGVHVQAESGISHIRGRPVPTVRRTLVADTASGPKVIASDDLYDVDRLAAVVAEKLRAPH
jgi:hypothetical protein